MRAEHIAWITGEQSPNRTDQRWAVGGTDLGIAWDDGQGGVLVAFGDTFNPRAPSGGGGGDWRSNVIGRSTDRDLTNGVSFDWFEADRPGHAREILPSLKIDNVEKTTIPTAGISFGGRQFLAYMSVQAWGDPGRWRTRYAGFAYSDDGGHRWNKPVGPGSPAWENTPLGDQRFQMLALAEHGDHVLIFGTPNGRAGSAYLARARKEHLLDPSRHEQWCPDGWRSGNGGVDQWRTVALFGPYVSELSVAYHPPSEQWLAAYFHEQRNAVVVHTAPEPTGPWSPPTDVATGQDYPGLYGFYFHPWTMGDPAPKAFMSQWGPYNVELMRLTGLVEQAPPSEAPAQPVEPAPDSPSTGTPGTYVYPLPRTR